MVSTWIWTIEAAACLAALVSASDDDVVGGDLDLLGQSPLDRDGQLDGDGAAAGECVQRRSQPALGQQHRVDAAGQLAQLVQRAGRLADQRVQLRRQLVGLGRHRRLRRAQAQGEGDQPLLGAVVQVALDAAPGVVGGGDDPRPRRGELGVELGVVQGDGELAGDERDGVEPVGGERAAQQPVLQQQHRPQACRG